MSKSKVDFWCHPKWKENLLYLESVGEGSSLIGKSFLNGWMGKKASTKFGQSRKSVNFLTPRSVLFFHHLHLILWNYFEKEISYFGKKTFFMMKNPVLTRNQIKYNFLWKITMINNLRNVLKEANFNIHQEKMIRSVKNWK